MGKNKNMFIVIAAVLVLAIGGGIAYALMQNSAHDHNDGTHSHPNEETSKTSSSNAASGATDAVETSSVEIKNFAYGPETITVKAGTKVTWTNQDTVEHNVVGDDLKDLDGPLLKKGESFSYTFDTPGEYSYYCAPHPYMKGTVIVTE